MWLSIFCQYSRNVPPIDTRFLSAHWIEVANISDFTKEETIQQLLSKSVKANEKGYGFNEWYIRTCIENPWNCDLDKFLLPTFENSNNSAILKPLVKRSGILDKPVPPIKKQGNTLF